MAFILPPENGTSDTTEANAFLFGLNWFIDNGLNCINTEIDFLLLQNYILHKWSTPWKIRETVDAIRTLAIRYNIETNHCFREANKVADKLASLSHTTNIYHYGLKDTTATYATNFLNLIPIVTFIFSTVLRVEKLRLRARIAVRLMVVGSLHRPRCPKVFPYKYSATFIVCLIATIQSAIVGACIDRRKASWKLGLNLQQITIFYSGPLAKEATFCLISWAGPTYLSMFNPLALIFVAIAEAVFLGQEMSVGSLLGMFLIIVGLYSFLRAKSKEFTQIGSPNAGVAEAPPPENEVITRPTNMELPILARESVRFQST